MRSGLDGWTGPEIAGNHVGFLQVVGVGTGAAYGEGVRSAGASIPNRGRSPIGGFKQLDRGETRCEDGRAAIGREGVIVEMASEIRGGALETYFGLPRRNRAA